MKVLEKDFSLLFVFLLVFFSGVSAFAAEKLEIIHENGLMTVSAEDVKPEDIFLELGKECNIEIIVKGEKFSEKAVSVKLEEMPIKDAVKRLVKVCGIKNYLMDFKNDSQGKSRLVKIDLSVGGSGQRVLTKGKQKTVKKVTKKKAVKKSSDSTLLFKEPYKTTFTKDNDFSWDGSAPIDFPEFKGELAYDKSEFSWDESAKSFSENTMDLVPPAVRGVVSEQIIKISDQVAKERGTDIITPDITSEAIQRIGKQASLPAQVMDLMPKTSEDFDRPRVPIDSEHLKEEFRE